LPKKIGFPEGLLVECPLRLNVLAAKKGVYAAFDKPSGILMDSYLGSPKCKSVMLALREQKGKGELERLGMDSPYTVNQLDIELSGATLIVMNKLLADTFRNAMWSGAFEFEYTLLCKAVRNVDSQMTVELPILMHEERPIWLVSHRFGKKAKTNFDIVESADAYQVWRATAKTVRPHQIRLHAAEAGLKVVSESIYSKTAPIYLSRLKEDDYKLSRGAEEERPLYDSICIHLSKIRFSGKDLGMPELGDVEIHSPLPRGFSACLKKLGFKETKY